MRYSTQPIGSDDDSGTSTDVSDVFSDGAADDISDSASEPDSSGDESDDSDGDSILNDEEEEQELSALHYLQVAESLDVSQLRQKRYSRKTQAKLDETRDYWDR
jgi:hypothetical protein